ncbi:hypothetical protein N7499_003242 [Penicillium canescens]|uniref:Nudix hydrolase domain-containing protein n=1 Tax=Penicillium canescens TaxID=5083 RepID=A0AAD6N641_PENCN|nr:hypothetical protein N7460_009979 [Penicillium canescens]KAJ6091091.1 hypothetical protein N7499_003242 [Penicillium canescens]KAJ6174731.1 hypothetical protein N7485_005175 [Penicillium canescens]
MGFSIIPVEDIEFPFTLIFLCDPHEPLTSYVLLCQRALLGKDENGNDKKNSWPFSWEPPGGSQEKFDKTILSTARRETKEEVNLHGSHISRQVYMDSWVHKGVPMARYTFPLEAHEPLKLQRTWCDSQQHPVGTNEGPIRLREDEHLDYCWVTEAQIRGSPLYDERNPQHQRGLVMIESKKEMILGAFMRLENSQFDMTYAL